uniref:Uncharacterized protein n=1 Tax=uncultured bacterium contig00015 TaxID=1181506 RepID=A0A806KI90_9BACT|nr:hypothetical protein [uncultured bacterium contig00015]
MYDKNVISPYQRLLSSPDLPGEVKAELVNQFALYDPVSLQQEVHDAVDALLLLNKTLNLERVKPLSVSSLHAI